MKTTKLFSFTPYGLGYRCHVQETPLGLMMTKTEDASTIPDDKLRFGFTGAAIDFQVGDRLVLSSGYIVHSMDKLPQLGRTVAENLAQMIPFLDGQMSPGENKWLIGGTDLVSVSKGKQAPEFLGRPDIGNQRVEVKFLVRYLDGSEKLYRQRVQNLPEDYAVTTELIQ